MEELGTESLIAQGTATSLQAAVDAGMGNNDANSNSSTTAKLEK